MSRYQEAIEHSVIFKDQSGSIYLPIVTSMLDFMNIHIYMPNEMIVTCGSHQEDLYIILDGKAAMFSINNEFLFFMK